MTSKRAWCHVVKWHAIMKHDLAIPIIHFECCMSILNDLHIGIFIVCRYVIVQRLWQLSGYSKKWESPSLPSLKCLIGSKVYIGPFEMKMAISYSFPWLFFKTWKDLTDLIGILDEKTRYKLLSQNWHSKLPSHFSLRWLMTVRHKNCISQHPEFHFAKLIGACL